MKRQTMAIGIITLLFLLVIFSYTKGEFSDYNALPIKEHNENSIQGINQGVGEVNTLRIEDNEYTYPIMKPDSETLAQWIEQYNNAPKSTSNTDPKIKMKASLEDENFSLLSYLEYNPSERDQGSCENCWAWAGTGILGIALNVKEQIKDRLSVQYINSCVSDVIGVPCCDGGFLYDLVHFYENTSKAIPWSNTNASWQDSDASCLADCATISTGPRYPIAYISEETITTHDVTNVTAIANIKGVLSQNKAVWFAFFLPTNNNWFEFFNFWFTDNESNIYNIDKFSGNPYDSGGGHAVLCVGWGQTDPDNQYWIILNSWGNITNRPNGLFLLDMDMNYSSSYPGLGIYGNNYCFYWQTLDVTFDIETPKVITNETTNVEEKSAKLYGYLQSNGSLDATCYFVWDNDSGEPYDIGNQSIGLVENLTEFSYNLSNLTKGELYYYTTKANNIAGWNNSGGERKFLTKPDNLITFNANMINSSKIVLTWADGTGGDGAYIEYSTVSQPDPWNIGEGMSIDNDGYATSPFNHTNLSSNTKYYYKAWSYAEKDGWKSSGNTTAPFGGIPQTENNKTNALSSVNNEFPSDNDTEIDKMQSTVNVTVEDPNGDNINWTIHGINIIQNSSNDINGSKSAYLITPLPYDTNIIWYVNVTDGYDWTNKTYNFTTRSNYIPNIPSSFSVAAYNRTQINLTWTNTENNNTYIEYNTTSEIWIKGEGNFLYNGTNLSCNHEDLIFNTQYFYQAWSYNVTDNVYSMTNISAKNSTFANQAPTISGESPSNNTENVDINQEIINVTINDPEGDLFNWTIHGTYVISNSSNDDTVNSKSADLIISLLYNTSIIWHVNVTDGYNWTNKTYNFITRNQYMPYPPDNLTANSKSKSRIDLSWIKGGMADNTYIRYKQGSIQPFNRTDGEELGNYSGESASALGLKSGQKYSFKAWSWNKTGNSWSTSNATCSVRTDSGGTRGSSKSPVIQSPEDETTEDEEQTVKDQVEDIFNITIDHIFYANDTDQDGMLKMGDFDDPNGILFAEHLINLSGNYTYLISVNGSKKDIFLWDTESDTVTEVTYWSVNVELTTTYTENDTITITVHVNKSNWIYIEISDEHPDISNLTVKTSYGRIISSDMIFRENGKIYVLDDPAAEYMFVYRYPIFSPIFNPVSGSTFNISKPVISIIYNENLTVIKSTLNGESINISSTIIEVSSANKHTFTYTPEIGLSNGNYTLNMTVKDDENNIRTDTATYIINTEPNISTPNGEFPGIIVIILMAILLFKTGNPYFNSKFIKKWKK